MKTRLTEKKARRDIEDFRDVPLCHVSLAHRLRGFQPNTYTFTKALAERLVEDEANDLPAVIARPSVGRILHKLVSA